MILTKEPEAGCLFPCRDDDVTFGQRSISPASISSFPSVVPTVLLQERDVFARASSYYFVWFIHLLSKFIKHQLGARGIFLEEWLLEPSLEQVGISQVAVQRARVMDKVHRQERPEHKLHLVQEGQAMGHKWETRWEKWKADHEGFGCRGRGCRLSGAFVEF